MSAMLTITELRKSYGDRAALAGANLTINAGEICALLGPNGAGKSTMVTIVAGLLRPEFQEFVRSCVLAMERHESQEWFRVNGRMVVDPHVLDRTTK